MAAPNLSTRVSAIVTVPFDGVRHSLLTLLQAVQPITPPRTRWMTFQVVSTSVGTLLVGDGPINDDGSTNSAALTASNYGLSIAPGAPVEYFYGINDSDYGINKFYVQAAVGVVTLAVQIIRA